jgi:putative phosphoesterase
MTKIGLISDTHNYLNPKLFDFFSDVDEIWHAGDIGSLIVLENLEKFKKVRAVYGNIDGNDLRTAIPKIQSFDIEEFKVLMVHIGGYPGRYERGITDLIVRIQPDLFISGHSHILKVVNDQKNKLLHINPGAAGNSGLHRKITFVRFCISSKRIYDLEIMEINR